MSALTLFTAGVMLNLLSQKTKAEAFSTSEPRPKGHITMWFFYARQKTAATSRRTRYVMADCMGRPLKRSADPWSVLRTLCSPSPDSSQNCVAVLYSTKEPIMHNCTQTPAKSRPQSNLFSLFNVIKRTPDGGHILGVLLPFDRAIRLQIENPGPGTLIKFAKWRGAE